MRVLIAEDSAVERLMLERFVRELGHECLMAEDGARAWELGCACVDGWRCGSSRRNVSWKQVSCSKHRRRS